MSELIPNILSLDKGLDLQSPKLVAPPGSVLDSLNYEQVDFQGQKRIDGYSRYDGSPLATVDDLGFVATGNTSDFGTYVLALNDAYEPFGIYIETLTVGNSDYDVVAVFDYKAMPETIVWGKDLGEQKLLTIAEHTALIANANNVIRQKVEGLPGRIAGLHWFRDRLYAVVDIEDYTPTDTRIDTANNASIFESRNIKQVLAEDAPGPYDFGWRFVHQGWWVDFKDGKVQSGKLTAKNQNRQNVGVQGPTSTEGTSGAPQLLRQSMAIANLPNQVNGWKTSVSPAVYNVEASALEELDSVYIYADAFVYWDGDTGVITAPGLDGNNLIEYPPTNTVEVS